jgi:hypothetical protein
MANINSEDRDLELLYDYQKKILEFDQDPQVDAGIVRMLELCSE